MGCAIDHVGCDGHLECGHGAWTARHCYACINPLDGGSCTAAATTGCGVGCQKCPDFPFDMHVMRQMVWRTGKRFLRPLRGGLNRDANGRYSDLITGSPLPIPRKIDFDRAPCWENDGTECFDSLCDCDFARGIDHCPSGSDFSLEIGKLTDCTAYTQSGRLWPLLENDGIDCRRLDVEKRSSPVHFSAGELCEPVNHRTHSCAANMMVLALAKIPGAECASGFSCWNTIEAPCSSAGQQPRDPPNYTYYAEAAVGIAGRRAWDSMRTVFAVSMLHSPNETSIDSATVDAKNKVLDVFRTAVNFSASGTNNFQTLSDMVSAPGGSNQNLGLWQRDSTLVAGNAPVSSYPPAMPITVRLRQSRASVQGVLRLYNASVQVKLVVLPIGVESSVSSTRAQWMPYARARIRAWTYLDFPAFDHTLIRDWKPEGAPDRTVVIHAAPGTPPDGLPTVTPIGVDDLIFENTNGVQFIPPRYVEWRGWLGEFSSPKTSHVFDGVSDTDQQSNLLRVALSTATNAQNGLRIPGWSDQHEGSLTHPVNTYGGYLQIGWSQ